MTVTVCVNMKKICAKTAMKNLSNEQKQNICYGLSQGFQKNTSF
jgi:hypothetical protein